MIKLITTQNQLGIGLLVHGNSGVIQLQVYYASSLIPNINAINDEPFSKVTDLIEFSIVISSIKVQDKKNVNYHRKHDTGFDMLKMIPISRTGSFEEVLSSGTCPTPIL